MYHTVRPIGPGRFCIKSSFELGGSLLHRGQFKDKKGVGYISTNKVEMALKWRQKIFRIQIKKIHESENFSNQF